MLGKGDREYAIPFFREHRLMIIDLIFATDPEIEKMGYRDIQWTGNTLTADITGLPADGKSRHIREIASPVFSGSGELDGAIESITDISMTEHRERVLGDTASKCMIILENIATAIAIIEEDAIISYVNPEFEKIIGYVREEVEGKKKWTEFVPPKELERMRKFEYESRINPENATPNHEFRFIRFDGQLRHGSLTMNRFRKKSGKLILSLVDISGKVQEGDALQKANRKLNSFSCITRDQILNHLTVVKGYIEFSRDQVRDPAFLLSPLTSSWPQQMRSRTLSPSHGTTRTWASSHLHGTLSQDDPDGVFGHEYGIGRLHCQHRQGRDLCRSSA